MKKTALYTRVSTQEQAKEGYSIGAQKERLEAYAVAKGYKQTELYTDPGLSGGNLERPGLQKLIHDIKNGLINSVLVYKLDRISRSQRDTLYLVQDVFIEHEVDFISLEENIDTSTPMGILMIGVLSAFAELERSTITQRSLLGREERAKTGLYHGGGNYEPLGYSYTNGKLILNPYEAIIVKEIYDLYINGNSINSTAKIIWEKYPDRVKSKTIVRDALKNSLYIGKVKFNGHEYPGQHEPIIDEDTFNQAQKIRNKRASGNMGTNTQKGLLVGKLFCAHCKARYGRVASGPKKYRYVNYICYSRRSTASRYLIKDTNCKNKSWKESTLDDIVIEDIKNFNYVGFEENIKRNQHSVSIYVNEIDKTNNQLERLLDLYVMDSIDKDSLNNKVEELNKKKKTLQNKINELKDTPIPHEFLLTIKNFDWNNETLQNKIFIIDNVIDRIELDNDEVTIYYKFFS